MTKPGADKETGPVLLITAFEPFDGAKTNSSLVMLEKLKEMDWQGKVVFLGPIPVSYDDAWPMIEAEMKRHPGLKGVLAMGQAEGRPVISLERRAVNWMSGQTPDNYGVQPKPQQVKKGEAPALWSAIPWQEMEPSKHCEPSYSAGGYICNLVMYHAVHWSHAEDGRLAGFLHIPLLKSQGQDKAFGKDSPRMDDADAIASLKSVIDFSLEKLSPQATAAPKKNFHPFRKPAGPKAA